MFSIVMFIFIWIIWIYCSVSLFRTDSRILLSFLMAMFNYFEFVVLYSLFRKNEHLFPLGFFFLFYFKFTVVMLLTLYLHHKFKIYSKTTENWLKHDGNILQSMLKGPFYKKKTHHFVIQKKPFYTYISRTLSVTVLLSSTYNKNFKYNCM